MLAHFKGWILWFFGFFQVFGVFQGIGIGFLGWVFIVGLVFKGSRIVFSGLL